MRFNEFNNQSASPAVANTTSATATAPQPQPVMSFPQKLQTVQQRKINKLVQQRAQDELEQEAKTTELDVVLAMGAEAELRRSGL